MLAITQITESFNPVFQPFSVEDFKDIPYSPVFLLPATFSPSITSHPEYKIAVEDGFNSYFQRMYEYDENDKEVFIPRSYTSSKLIAEIAQTLKPNPRLNAIHETPLAWHAGFLLGTLSAIALTDRPLALKGRDLLVNLVEQQRS